MSDIAEQNRSLLSRRWPALARRVLAATPPEPLQWTDAPGGATLAVAGQRLWSAYDAQAEARMQARGIPADSRHAWVYGVGGGDLPRELLRRTELQRLTVVVLNPGLFRYLLHSLDHRDWLADPRVHLVSATDEACPRAPFAVIPPCLTLCDDDAARLREQLSDELLRPFERERLQRHAPRRRRQIDRNLPLLATDGDVRMLFDSAPRSRACVALAGPTLHETAARIRQDCPESLLIAVDAALAPLLAQGLVPDVVVSVDDKRATILRYFSGDLSRCAESVLVYTPVVHHDVLQRWPGRRLAAYTFESIYDRLRDGHPRGELHVAGSVAHPAVDLALKTGATEIRLFGADFGFPQGRLHANADAPVDFYANAAAGGTHAADGHGRRIATLPSFNGYRLGLERLIARHPGVDFINMSRAGARIHGARYPDQGSP